MSGVVKPEVVEALQRYSTHVQFAVAYYGRPWDEIRREMDALHRANLQRWPPPIGPMEREDLLLECVADLRLRVAALEAAHNGGR